MQWGVSARETTDSEERTAVCHANANTTRQATAYQTSAQRAAHPGAHAETMGEYVTAEAS